MFTGLPVPLSPHAAPFILKEIGNIPLGDYYIYQVLFLFIIYSFTGWLLEMVYRSWHAGRPVNPGFLTGPLVPLYGAGVLVIIYLSDLMAPFSMPARAMGYFVVITMLEFLTGELLLAATGRRFWDYTDCRFHLRGHVCLRFSVYWVIMAFIFEYALFPLSMSLIARVPEGGLNVFNTLAVFFIIGDTIITLAYRRGLITLPLYKGGKLADAVGRLISTLWPQEGYSSLVVKNNRLLKGIVDDLRRRNWKE